MCSVHSLEHLEEETRWKERERREKRLDRLGLSTRSCPSQGLSSLSRTRVLRMHLEEELPMSIFELDKDLCDRSKFTQPFFSAFR